jgi:hypothetical protein
MSTLNHQIQISKIPVVRYCKHCFGFGSGLDPDSKGSGLDPYSLGSGSRQTKIVPQMWKKGKKIMLSLRVSLLEASSEA